MNRNNIMKINESALWTSIIALSILSITLDSSYSLITIFWVLSITLIGNAKRVYSEKYFKSATVIRRTIYFIPLLFPAMIGFKPNLLAGYHHFWSIVGFILGIMFLLPKINEWRIVFAKDFIEISRYISGFDVIMQMLTLIGAAICEEFFFRGFLLGYYPRYLFIQVLLSVILFFLFHFGCKWADKFNKFDFTVQLLFGAISAALFIFSKSILPCMIAHLTFNLPLMILTIKKYRFHKCCTSQPCKEV